MAILFPAVDSVEVDSVDESVGTLKRDSANEKEVGHHFTDTTYRCDAPAPQIAKPVVDPALAAAPAEIQRA